MLRSRVVWVVTLLGFVTLGVVVLGVVTRSKAVLGLSDARLPPCPSSPNCVCSVDPLDRDHYVEPFRVAEGVEGVLGAIAAVIRAQPRTRLGSRTEDYLHAEFTSRLLRFVDDVEFHHQPQEKLIHVRSASRIGRSDFGVNRRRIEALRLELLRRGVLSR